MLVLSGGFVAIIMFYFATTEVGRGLIYLCTLISLHSIMLLATGIALVKINKVPTSFLTLSCGVNTVSVRRNALLQRAPDYPSIHLL